MKLTSKNQVRVEIELEGDDLVQLSKGMKLSFKKEFDNLPIGHKGDSVEFSFIISLKGGE